MNSLVAVHGFDKQLMSFGFFPSMVSKDKIAIADIKNDRELHFTSDTHNFVEHEAGRFDGFIPEKVKNVIGKANAWFENFKIVAPERNRRRLRDPFLFGIKDGKYYFICGWDLDIWDK